MSNQKSMASPHPSVHQTKESQPLITRSGSQLLVEALQQEDVDFIFGYPGGAVLPLYLSLIHISEPTRHSAISRMPSSA